MFAKYNTPDTERGSKSKETSTSMKHDTAK